MKLFGFEIKRAVKERIITFTRNHEPGYGVLRIEIELTGSGWGVLEKMEIGNEITSVFNKMPSKLTVEEKVEILQLFIDKNIKCIIK